MSLFEKWLFGEILVKATFENLAFSISQFCNIFIFFGEIFLFSLLLYFLSTKTNMSFIGEKKQWQSKTHTSSPSMTKS